MYSFDIFDTLITRSTATPDGIFALMQQELLTNQMYQRIPEYIKKNFFTLRKNAEVLANSNYRKEQMEEITLEQVYHALKINGNLSEEDCKLFITLERKTEIENAIGIKENIEKVKQLIHQNEHVVLISDMYLDVKTVRAMLRKADSIFENITIYVSSEHKSCKWSGNLFRLIKESENVDYADWIHTGDNMDSDCRVAKDLGIQVHLYSYEKLNQCERNALQNKENDAFVQLTVGAARNARLFHKLTDTASRMGATLGGPILFPYVWWILQNSIKQGIKRLYFIARDGYILKEIADRIIAFYHYEIKTDYIYGSRRVWRMASVSKNNNDIENIVISSYLRNVLTCNELAELFELSLQELYEYFDLLQAVDPNEMMSAFIRNYIKSQISYGKEELVSFLQEKHKEKKALVIEYLTQEIDFGISDFAFVEMAGSGLTQGCLAEISRDFTDKPLKTFYFKLDLLKTPPNCIFYVFFPSMLKHHIIVETLTRAPHGQTIGYTRDNEKIIPLLDDSEGEAIIDHGFNEYGKGITCFTTEYLKAMTKYPADMDKIELLNDYFQYIVEAKELEVLDFLGGMPNKVTGREKEIVEFAPVLSDNDIRNIYLLKENEPVETYYKGTDFAFSLLRSGEKANKKIEFYVKNRNTWIGKTLKALYKKRKTNSSNNEFPLSILKEKVAIYAAGKYGQALYNKINKVTDVVLWVDANYNECREKGLPVSSIDMINTVEFDQIFIAMLNEKSADKVRETLINRGVSNHKIIWLNFMV